MKTHSPTKEQLRAFIIGLFVIPWVLLVAHCLKLFLWDKCLDWQFYGNAFVFSLKLWILFSWPLAIIYFLNKKFMVQFYKVWMLIVTPIGVVMTTIIMLLIFFLVFTPVGLFLRLIRKDILNLKKDSKLKTYWIDRPSQEFNKARYEKQF